MYLWEACVNPEENCNISVTSWYPSSNISCNWIASSRIRTNIVDKILVLFRIKEIFHVNFIHCKRWQYFTRKILCWPICEMRTLKYNRLKYAGTKILKTFIFYVASTFPSQPIIEWSLWCFLFCKEDVALLQGALKNCRLALL